MNNILVIADFNEEQTIAIERAIECGKIYNTAMHIVYFCYENLRHVAGDKAQIKEKIMASLTATANAQLAAINFEGVEVTFDVVWEKHIPQWTQRYVHEKQPKLVIKTGHRSETLFYTPTDWQLLRECDAPLMIASETKWRKAPNILAAIDLETTNPSKQALNSKILKQAKALADARSAELYVCYTIPFSTLLRDLGIQYIDELELQANRVLEKQITELAITFDIPASHFILKAGQPEKVIPSTAANVKAGVVVLGTVARKGIAGRVMGNTAEKVLKLLKSDVIAIKPDS
ncbi:universal stress protein [Colwellia sp. MEBiC06753]